MEAGIQKVKRKHALNESVLNEKTPNGRPLPSWSFARSEGSRILLTGDILRQVRGDRQFEAFALIGLDHQQNPQDERSQVD
jgi:hypothetical protein